MATARDQSLQVVKGLSIDVSSNSLDCGLAVALLDETTHLEPPQRRLVVTELAVRLWLNLLSTMGSFYPEFELFLWHELFHDEDLESQMHSYISPAKVLADVIEKYSRFLKSMFSSSNKTRNDFYDDMLLEAGIRKELGCFDFGERALAFRKRVRQSVHREHLLVYYSVELYLKACEAVNSKDIRVSDAKLEEIYRHFEEKIPLMNTFDKYTKDDSYFNYSARRQSLPSMD